MNYSHFYHSSARPESPSEKWVQKDTKETPNCPDPLFHALYTLEIARLIGIQAPLKQEGLPYSESDNLLFSAPLVSLLAGKDCRFLRGWKQFGSCVKGFNALGLMAEHAYLEEKKILQMTEDERHGLSLQFLSSRRSVIGVSHEPIFSSKEMDDFQADPKLSEKIPILALALWKAFASRTIVCSTSSNMGISLHEALRYLQQTEFFLNSKPYRLLNANEGSLIIWCPDENADFMNTDKTIALRALEAEEPPLTQLHTYINRQQRDPGALRDALILGGYFFPTNPQSSAEMENLVSRALQDLCESEKQSFSQILKRDSVRQCLKSLGARIENQTVTIHSGVNGGLYGLMIPYLLMFEESLRENVKATSTWNQASIGAALAAAVLADQALRDFDQQHPQTLNLFQRHLPRLFATAKAQKIGKSIPTQIHGTFDIANLQSLAQLYGVVLDKHLSGRATAFVGLGSSSYANGNSVFETLNDCMEKNGAFRGRESLHPATHALNPISQALIFGEDLFRIVRTLPSKLSSDALAEALRHVKKPEPAGAASLTGYLLSRLDQGSLSFLEVALSLRLMGFNRQRLLAFCGYGENTQSYHLYVQDAYEEGERMGQLIENILQALNWPISQLCEWAQKERSRSRLNYLWHGLDPEELERRQGQVNLYLTGDNCQQPNRALVESLMEASLGYRDLTEALLEADELYSRQTWSIRSVYFMKRIVRSFEYASQICHRLGEGLQKVFLKPAARWIWSKSEKESPLFSQDLVKPASRSTLSSDVDLAFHSHSEEETPQTQISPVEQKARSARQVSN